MYNWSSKKLLVLGATKFIAEIVKEAKKYGAYVVVADYNKVAPAKEIADEAVLIDVMDITSIVEYIKNNNIDGVLTGFTDSLLLPYIKICEASGLPCYISIEQEKITTDKTIFKKLCRKFNIKVLDEYTSFNHLEYPVIVKPVDNSGARGISICYNDEEFYLGKKIALENSKSNQILVEKYVNFQEATVFYIFINGVAHFIAMGDRYVKSFDNKVLRLPTGYCFPSRGIKKFYQENDKKFKRMFNELKIKNGLMFIQGFLDAELNFIPYECGFRLTGSLEYKLIQAIQGYNPLSMLINFAITGKMLDEKQSIDTNPFFKKNGYNISCQINPGKIKKIIGENKIKNLENIIDCFFSYEEDDIIPNEAIGKLSQIGIRILFIADKQEYDNTISYIKNNLSVLDENNQEMLINKEILI